MSDLHPAAPHHLPGFITAPGETDILMVGVGIFLIGAVLMVGIFYLHLHTLPERMAHKSQKLQFEIVAVLGLLALFTHNHLFWVIGLFLAMIDLPDFGTPLRRIAGSVEKMAGITPEPDPAEAPDHAAAVQRANELIQGPRLFERAVLWNVAAPHSIPRRCWWHQNKLADTNCNESRVKRDVVRV